MLESRIKECISESGYTRKHIAENLGVSHQQISNWVVGKSYPTTEKAFKLAYMLNCKVDDLYDYKGD